MIRRVVDLLLKASGKDHSDGAGTKIYAGVNAPFFSKKFNTLIGFSSCLPWTLMKNDFIKKCVHDLPTCCQLLPNQMYSESQASELAYDKNFEIENVLRAGQGKATRRGLRTTASRNTSTEPSRHSSADSDNTSQDCFQRNRYHNIDTFNDTIICTTVNNTILFRRFDATRGHSGRGLLSCQKHKTCCLETVSICKLTA